MKNSTTKSIITAVLIIGFATIINSILNAIGVHDANLIMIYILAVIIIAIVTEGFLYTIISPIVIVLLFNFFYTDPRLSLSTYDNQYPLTFLIMLTISLIAATMTSRLKNQIELSN
ncbi:MAG: DUF4118 domain-containing protein, partial [Candidatus Izemoplasmataceae bacterium]